jgi:hypothetical protein
MRLKFQKWWKLINSVNFNSLQMNFIVVSQTYDLDQLQISFELTLHLRFNSVYTTFPFCHNFWVKCEGVLRADPHFLICFYELCRFQNTSTELDNNSVQLLNRLVIMLPQKDSVEIKKFVADCLTLSAAFITRSCVTECATVSAVKMKRTADLLQLSRLPLLGWRFWLKHNLINSPLLFLWFQGLHFLPTALIDVTMANALMLRRCAIGNTTARMGKTNFVVVRVFSV